CGCSGSCSVIPFSPPRRCWWCSWRGSRPAAGCALRARRAPGAPPPPRAGATVLVVLMAGLALGSWLLARRAPRLGNLIAAYGWLEVGIGVYCALLPLLLSAAATTYLALARGRGVSDGTFTLVQFILAGLVLLVPTTLMGGTLPVLGQALAREPGRLGRTIGALYAINTFGAVAGVAVAGYLLLPAVGNRWSLLIGAAANLAVGALAIAYAGGRPAAAPAVA